MAAPSQLFPHFNPFFLSVALCLKVNPGLYAFLKPIRDQSAGREGLASAT